MTTTADLLAGPVMDDIAVLMNDPSKTQYTYTKILPYLNIASRELKETYEHNDVPVTEAFTSSPIAIPVGYDHISFNNGSNPSLPNDFIEPIVLWERESGTNPFVMMRKVNYLPRWIEGTEIDQFIWYTWQSQEIRFFPSVQANDIKMDYVREIFPTLVDQNSAINVINARTYLAFRGAGHCAQFIAENPTRAQVLYSEAVEAMDRDLGIASRGQQNITTRRRPFRAGYKSRSFL